jgi:hypothetical protein
MNEGTTLIPASVKDVASKLNSSVLSVIGDNNMVMFEKTYLIAKSIIELQELLTPEYMKPIMALQGSKLGFKTDRDDKGGYPIEVVKNCLIEAVLTGLAPYGNQFNIIAGNMYTTKEGFGHLLSKLKGLTYKIIPGLPRVNAEKTGAAVSAKVKWTMNGVSQEEDLDLAIKMNSFMGTDAIIGKSTRKARAWLFNTINKTEIADGDATEVTHEVIATKIEKADNRAADVAAGVKGMLSNAGNVDKNGQASLV